jgi:4-hydroxybenzoate polyprenyltransferase
MYLNDAFDSQFDQQHRPERPVPSGTVGVAAVWACGFVWLGLGLLCLIGFGKATMILGLLLVVTILTYDAVHKIFAFSPVLMAACRFLLILLAASTGKEGVTGLSIWTGLVLALYIVGLSYVARRESTLVPLRYWPCAGLAAPLVLAFIVNSGQSQSASLVLSGIVIVWTVRCLHFSFWSAQRNFGRTVAGLLAGIPLVDLLSVWEGGWLVAVLFGALFLLSLLFQRFVPAT